MKKTYLNIEPINAESVQYIAEQANVPFEVAEKYVEEELILLIEESIERAFEEAIDELYVEEEEVP